MGKQLTLKELLQIIKNLILEQITSQARIRKLEKEKKVLEMQLDRERAKNAELEEMAGRDALSGLLNRTALGKKKNVEPEEIVVMIDIDDFKPINDNFGHEFGNNFISIMGEVISNGIYSSDLAFRYGGDEFLIIFRNCPYEKAIEKVETITRAYEERTQEVFGQKVTFSAGIFCANELLPITQAISCADQMMYEVKYAKKGKGRRKKRKKIPKQDEVNK